MVKCSYKGSGKMKKKKIDKNKVIGILLLLIAVSVIVFVLIFYLSPKEKPKKEKKPEIVEKKKLQIVDEDSNERPIAVMIDNNIGEGRHAGLQDSYINYEIIVEGGLTRIMAIFKDNETLYNGLSIKELYKT